MMPTLIRLVVLFALFTPTLLHAEATFDPSNFVLFIHAGPKSPNDNTVKIIAGALVRQGYLVREPDQDQDIVGGPGVDFFAKSAYAAAQEVANIVNILLSKLEGQAFSDNKKLKPRFQRVKNPPNYLGVWLF